MITISEIKKTASSLNMSKIVNGSGMNALIVDDNALIGNVAQKLLDSYGFATKIVENGQQAVDIFNAGNSFDVVFMDMEMPIMDGIKATKELRAMGVKSLIFGVTTSESKSDIKAFKEAGLDEYFEKPLNFVKIDSVLRRLKNYNQNM
ncbi:two-component response regulator 24-like [Amaranthus tricolor]|uniref:two-component response regulator 24-like n=1 Tax=Amaranthus tricolor TaxID=29722 RepID=UPI0025837CAF|nr:two-component response regulator 24-like [Amaranthus tricolor]